MSDHAQNLRQAADEIRREGHAGWGNACEWAADEIERLTAALHAQPGPVNMDDVEWAGKAHLADAIRERDELRRQLAEAQKEIHNLNWALGTEGYDQMATPEEQAEHEAAVRAHHDVLERLEEGKRAYEAMKQDARRYRDWLRGGANIPPESTRWPRWEVRHWDGRHWNTLFAEALDTSIDAAMGGSDAG